MSPIRFALNFPSFSSNYSHKFVRPFSEISSSKNGSRQLRQLFFDFFTSRGHQRLPSAPVLTKHNSYNQCDFVCAGVQQFSPVLVGEQRPPAKRIVNSQKCIRLVDKDLIGVENQHHTFFEMLGNWSFGDYHKIEACTFAWQFLTQTLGIEPSRFYITYFGGDEEFEADNETREIWKQIGIPDSHILPFGGDHNFWRLGPGGGPCGSCTEIHVDKKTERRENAAHLINSDDPSIIELWNLVFMQYNRHPNGSITVLPLERIVDTGMGFERLCALIQGRESAYETDLFQPIIERISQLSSSHPIYQGRLAPIEGADVDSAFRIVADHIRTIVVTLAEGIIITDKKKYARKMKDMFKKMMLTAHEQLGMPRGTLAELVPPVVDSLADAHPELRQNGAMVTEAIKAEEARTWAQRDKAFRRMEHTFRIMTKGSKKFPGKLAYELVHKYRLEFETIAEFINQKGMKIDEDEFQTFVDRRNLSEEKQIKNC